MEKMTSKLESNAQPAGTDDILGRITQILRSWDGYAELSRLLQKQAPLNFYLAGGSIRNLLLGLQEQPKDFDFFVGGLDLPSLIAALDTSGIVKFGPYGSPYWSPRGSSSYVDVVHIEHFHNGLSSCKTIDDALAQFDFTANAVAVNLRTGQLHDPVGGLHDIRHRVLRAVRFDYPDEPISPKYRITRLSVLWFRLLHYAARYKLEIEPATMDWLLSHRRYREDFEQFRNLFFAPHPESLLIYDKN